MGGRPVTAGRLRSLFARWAERIALASAVLPTVVMVFRAWRSQWVPLFDAAYFTVRSRDVLTPHNPLVGAWSMGSREVGVWINNLGPLQLDLLAPFTKIDPYWGTALGVGVTNVAAIVGVWFVSRTLFGSLGVIGAMAATVLIQLNEGSLMLIEARQQLALVLPMWCLLWLASAVWSGERWAVPSLAFVASLVLQTHFTYAYQAIAIALGAALAIVVRFRSRLDVLVAPALCCAAVLVLVWIQPLWDQVFTTGNLTTVFQQRGGSERSVGISRGLTIMAESLFVPPFFTPGSMGDLLREGDRVNLAVAVGALTCWAALLVAVVVLMRSRHRSLAAMGAVSLVALASSVYAVTKIPPTEQFGIIAQNYYWLWPVGIFMGTTVVGSALRGPLVRFRETVGARGSNAIAAGLIGVTILGTIPLLTPTNALPETDHEWAVSRLQARPLIDQLDESLDAREFAAPVLVDLGAVRHVRYTLLNELQQRGIDFRFSPGATDLSRFGQARCDDGSADHLLILRGGYDAVLLDTDDTLLATVPGLTTQQAARSSELATAFGDALRDGTITVDEEAIVALGGDVPQLLDQVLSSPGMAARRLSLFVTNWFDFGAVTVPSDLVGDLREWRTLERSSADDRMAIYLRAISPHRPDRCDDVEPGEHLAGGTR